MNELQQEILKIYKQFQGLCEKMGLKYIAIGGTAIGAVRHKGFIPWDDDMDIAMPLEDYRLFLQHGQELLPPELFIQTPQSDKYYLLPFAKIRNSQTTYKEAVSRHSKMNSGIFIDIFPLVAAKKSKSGFYFQNFAARMEKHIVFSFVNKNMVGLNKVGKSENLICRRLFARVDINKIAEDLFFRYHNMKGGNLTIGGGVYGFLDNCPKEWLEVGKKVPFEDTYIFLPKNYDEYLKQIYKDYMTPPPKEKQKQSHAIFYDCHKSYTEYK